MAVALCAAGVITFTAACGDTSKLSADTGSAAKEQAKIQRALDRLTATEAPGAIALVRRHATTGICVTRDGHNESEDLTLAARNALLNMIDYLGTRGYDAQQAYALCSVAVDLRISQTVDVPNLMVTAILPLDIFV